MDRRKRFQARRSNGRFTKNTLENTVGLHCEICPHCRRFNPYGLHEPKPTQCHACGQLLEVECPVCHGPCQGH